MQSSSSSYADTPRPAHTSPHHTGASRSLGASSSVHVEAPRSLHTSSSEYSGELQASSYAEDSRPAHAEGSRQFISYSSCRVEDSRPTSSDYTGALRQAQPSSAFRPAAGGPGTGSVPPEVEFVEECEAIAAELDMMDDGNGWDDFDTQDMLIGDSEMDLGALPPQPPHSTGQASFHPHASNDIPVSKASSSKSSFKPPFLQQDNGRLNSSFAGASRKPSMFKPSTGKALPKDDASEFRGQYQHTREMYKIFHQVCVDLFLHGVYSATCTVCGRTGVRVEEVSPQPAGGSERSHPEERLLRAHAYWRRKELMLPASGPHDPRGHCGRLPSTIAHAGPDTETHQFHGNGLNS